MSTLKNKIEELQSKTTSTAVFNACNEALRKIEGNKAYVAVNESELEALILTGLMETLVTSDINDSAADSFVSEKNFETREKDLANLGVNDTFESLSNEDIAKHPAFLYVFEKLKASSAGLPEWKVLGSVIEALKAFSWDPAVNERMKVLVENSEKFREDIQVYTIVEGIKNSSSSYLYKGIVAPLEAYLKNRTSADRVNLMEATGKFLFDKQMKALYNFLGESERIFHIASTDNTVSIDRIYSPISLTEACEYFVAAGKVFKKFKNTIAVANENEVNALPSDFKAVANILSWDNVTIAEGLIKVYAGDKKVEIYEENLTPIVKINGIVTNKDDIHRAFLNSGVFRITEGDSIRGIQILVENWHNIFEMDFAKVINSKVDTNKVMTVFFLGENIFVNKENRMLKEDVFYSNCNANQTKNLVMEFMKFDISSSFSALLTEEEKEITAVKNLKSEYMAAIDMLSNRKLMLEAAHSTIRDTAEVKDLIEALDDEILLLKEEYSKIASAELSTTIVSEGLGFNVGDEAELLKKK